MPFWNPFLRRVRHATFDQLAAAGHDVRIIDDGAEPLDPIRTSSGDLPEHWKITQPVIKPKIATLRDTTLFIDGSALLPDGRYCYFDPSFAGKHWHRPHARRILLRTDAETDRALIRRHFRSIDVPGRCFSTRTNNLGNLAHFVHDVLSRIYYEDLGVLVPGRDKVIAPRISFPMQEALFRKVYEGYEIMQAPSHVPLRVEELLLPANLCGDETFNPQAIAALAGKIRRFMVPYAGKEKFKVCVSRLDATRRWGRQTHGRDFVNEEAYETLMGKLGYRVTNVSALAPEAQFSLWANTTHIVGVHGAGMLNTIMMPPEGCYLEIAGAPAKHKRGGSDLCPNHTARCAMAAGHRVVGISGHLDAHGRPTIDLDRLKAMLHDAP